MCGAGGWIGVLWMKEAAVMKAKEAAWELDDGRSCRMCGGELTRWNCRWKIFPWICDDCAPPGLMHRRVRRKVAGRRAPRVPRDCEPLRLCECGQVLEPHKKMCEDCRDKARQEAYRKRDRHRSRKTRHRKRQMRRRRTGKSHA